MRTIYYTTHIRKAYPNELYHGYSTELYHHGIKGQKWGVRRYQNPDGTLTALGKVHYGLSSKFSYNKTDREWSKKVLNNNKIRTKNMTTWNERDKKSKLEAEERNKAYTKAIDDFQSDMAKEGWFTKSKGKGGDGPYVTMVKPVGDKHGLTLNAAAHSQPGSHVGDGDMSEYNANQKDYWTKGEKRLEKHKNRILDSTYDELVDAYENRGFATSGITKTEFLKACKNVDVFVGGDPSTGKYDLVPVNIDFNPPGRWGGQFYCEYDLKSGKLTPMSFDD